MPAADEQERRDALPLGAALGAYTIEEVLGHGGFGIVYRARHNELGNVAAVKEYLPAELAVREGASVHPRSAACRAGYEDGLRRFRDEARALVEFQAHPSIVSCRDFFRANGTAYLVMEHEEGLPLSELLRRREASGRPFDEADLLAVMVPLLEGLRRVHEAGMLHRDIKPGNVLVRRSDERPVLIDFGAAKQGIAERSKSLAPYTEGYAALEQVGEGKLGPWTDVYAAGAVMWRIVAGGNPPWAPPNPVKVEKRANAVVRGEADPMPSARELGAGRFSPGVLAAIDRCLKLNEKERARDCGELLALLRGAGAEPAAETAGRGPVRKRREEPAAAAATAALQAGSRKRLWGLLTAAGVVLAAAWFALGSGERFRAGEVFRDCAECPQMVVVPAGSFLMGSPESEEERDDDEGPQRQVTIREPFAVGAYEVTVAEYREFISAAGRDGGTDCVIFAEGEVNLEGSWRDPGFEQTGRDPVVCVSWKDAQAYVRWLSLKTGEEYRLLSEAEWEYSVRAGSQTRYSFGDEITPSDANYGRNIGKTQPVGSYRANGYGLHDMHGNAWEWVRDCWNDSYAGAPNNGGAWERGDCSPRDLRGGSWVDGSRYLRSANRDRDQTVYRISLNGFRVARTLKP